MIKQNDITKYWEKEVCGTRYIYSKKDKSKHYEEIRNFRYSSEPYIKEFAFGEFVNIKNKTILEIGVGAGIDFIEFLKKGAICYGIDATKSAINETKKNISYALPNNNFKLKYLEKINAEKLPFKDNYFDIVYSHGVLHHAKNTMKCISEAERVLKKGGTLKLMVYSSFSATGLMLWAIYGLAKFNLFISQEELMYRYLESPGTKTYSYNEFKKIIEGFSFKIIKIKKNLGCGDLLLIKESKKYKNNLFFKIIKKIYPRFIIRKFENFLGVALTVIAVKE